MSHRNGPGPSITSRGYGLVAELLFLLPQAAASPGAQHQARHPQHLHGPRAARAPRGLFQLSLAPRDVPGEGGGSCRGARSKYKAARRFSRQLEERGAWPLRRGRKGFFFFLLLLLVVFKKKSLPGRARSRFGSTGAQVELEMVASSAGGEAASPYPASASQQSNRRGLGAKARHRQMRRKTHIFNSEVINH